MLDDRKLEVLRAIVTDYVESQEPVGSRALVERHKLDVSPATVRNDMAVLEDEGYITQPHTSAGRIPTDAGYRLFVDKLATVKPLSIAERRAIETFMTGANDLDELVHRTVRLLSQITHQVAIMQYPITSSAIIRHIELLDMDHDRLMIIVVNSSGGIEQRFTLIPGIDADTTAVLRDRVADAMVGRTASEAAERLALVTESIEPASLPAAEAVVGTLLAMLTAGAEVRVAVGGVPNVARFGASFQSAVAPILEALEEQVVLLRLLGEATSGGGEVAVRIGSENDYGPLQSTSLVASAYPIASNQGMSSAGLGIVGPTRMDYPSMMSAVRAIARYVGSFLSEG